MDRDAAATLAVIDPQPAEPGHERRDGVGPLPAGNVGAELDERVAARDRAGRTRSGAGRGRPRP